jgi:hypothetical protein
MPQSFAQIYLHSVFSTKNREPLLREMEFPIVFSGISAEFAGILIVPHCQLVVSTTACKFSSVLAVELL